MFTLGFTRHYRATLDPKHDLVSRKIGLSMLNGFYYASPFGVLKLMHAIDRIEIFVRENFMILIHCKKLTYTYRNQTKRLESIDNQFLRDKLIVPLIHLNMSRLFIPKFK